MTDVNTVAENAQASLYTAKSILVIGMIGIALGEGYAAGKAFEAMGRNPDAIDKIFSKMIIGLALIESAGIYTLIMFFLIG